MNSLVFNFGPRRRYDDTLAKEGYMLFTFGFEDHTFTSLSDGIHSSSIKRYIGQSATDKTALANVVTLMGDPENLHLFAFTFGPKEYPDGTIAKAGWVKLVFDFSDPIPGVKILTNDLRIGLCEMNVCEHVIIPPVEASLAVALTPEEKVAKAREWEQEQTLARSREKEAASGATLTGKMPRFFTI